MCAVALLVGVRNICWVAVAMMDEDIEMEIIMEIGQFVVFIYIYIFILTQRVM